MTTLQVVWFAIMVFLAAGYAVLDGYDLGVACWLPWAGSDRRRRILVRAILPFWDGNEVWLLAVGGASFAAFPPFYAAVFSGLYLPVMLLLFALIVRAVSIEMSSHEPSGLGRLAWHGAMWAASATALFIVGVAFGNILNGMTLDANGDYRGGLLALLNPLALTLGALNVALMSMHGALFLGLRLEGDMLGAARRWAAVGWGGTMALLLATAGVAAEAPSGLTANYEAYPVLWLAPFAALLAMAMAGVWSNLGRAKAAFAASTVGIVALIASGAVGLFPRLVPATDPALSLTVISAAATDGSLTVMLAVALIGMPVVVAYTAWTHWVFRRLDPDASDHST